MMQFSYPLRDKRALCVCCHCFLEVRSSSLSGKKTSSSSPSWAPPGEKELMLHHLHHGWLSLSCYFVHWYSPSTPYAAHSPWEKNNKDGQVKARWTVILLNDQDEWGTLQDFQSVPPAWLVSLNHKVVLQHRAASSPPLINKSIPFSKSNSGILCDHRQAGRLRRNNEVKFTSKSNIKTKPKEKKIYINIFRSSSLIFASLFVHFMS